MGADVLRISERQELNQAQQNHAEHRQLQNVSADTKRAEAPAINQPENQDAYSAEEKQSQRPIVNRPVRQRGKYDRQADLRNAKRLASVCRMR